jgi:hypothetical protein
VSFINGIYHSPEDWARITEQLRVLFDDPEIFPFYNPSTGWWVKDATEAGLALLRRPDDLSTALELTSHLRNALEIVGERGRVLHIAHSGYGSIYCLYYIYPKLFAFSSYSLTFYDYHQYYYFHIV